MVPTAVSIVMTALRADFAALANPYLKKKRSRRRAAAPIRWPMAKTGNGVLIRNLEMHVSMMTLSLTPRRCRHKLRQSLCQHASVCASDPRPVAHAHARQAGYHCIGAFSEVRKGVTLFR